MSLQHIGCMRKRRKKSRSKTGRSTYRLRSRQLQRSEDANRQHQNTLSQSLRHPPSGYLPDAGSRTERATKDTGISGQYASCKTTRIRSHQKQIYSGKDTAYQRIGHYLVPAQVIERNLHRSFLRFQTDETGVVSLTSIYCGSYNIHHTAVKVTAPDGNFTETSVSRDSYETTDLGEYIEKADYKLGEDGGVIAFVAANKDKTFALTSKVSVLIQPTCYQPTAKQHPISTNLAKHFLPSPKSRKI